MKAVEWVADSILITAGTGCLVFLAHNLLTYGWSLNYLVLLLALVAVTVAFRLQTSAKVSAVLLLISVVLPVYAVEAILAKGLVSHLHFNVDDWLNFPSDFSAESAVHRMREGKASDAAYDARTRLEVIEDMRERGDAAYPLIFPEVMFKPAGRSALTSLFTADNQEFLPLAGVSNTPTVFCNESGEYIVYHSDEHGFHNPPGLWSGTAHIAAVGDSFAHGACVPSDKGFVSVIRSSHPATVNLGMSGNGPLAGLATVKEYGALLRPKILLWCFFEGNDGRDLDRREKNSPLLMKYLEPAFSQNLAQRQAVIDGTLTAYLDEAMRNNGTDYTIEHFLKLHYLRGSIRSMMNKRPSVDGIAGEIVDSLRTLGAPSNQADMDLFRSILSEANKTVAAWGGRMYFVYLPTWERYRLPELANKDRDAVLRIVKGLGISLLDLHSAFSNHPDPLSLFPARRYAHYNIQGHRLVADEILHFLDKESRVASVRNGHTPGL